MSAAYEGTENCCSCTCPRCGNPILGPIRSLDDIKWFVGNMAFSGSGPNGEPISYDRFLDVWRTAVESIEIMSLSAEMNSITEKAIDLGCYTEHMRKDLRQLLDKCDAISSGTRKMIEDRSHLPNFLRPICHPEVDKEEKEVYNKESGLATGEPVLIESFPPDLYKNGKSDELHATEN